MSFAIEISEVGPAELPLIEVLRDTIFAEFGHISRSTVAAGLTGGQDVFLLMAHLEGNPLGFSIGYQRTADSYYINYMAILRDYRRQGIGRQFMQRQESFARARGYETIQFNTQNKFAGMIRLGIAMGYRPIGMEKHHGTMNSLVIRFGKTFGHVSEDAGLHRALDQGDEIAGLVCDPANDGLKVVLRSEAK